VDGAFNGLAGFDYIAVLVFFTAKGGLESSLKGAFCGVVGLCELRISEKGVYLFNEKVEGSLFIGIEEFSERTGIEDFNARSVDFDPMGFTKPSQGAGECFAGNA